MADGRTSHKDGRLDALRHLAVAGPLTAYGLASRLSLSEGLARQRLRTMGDKGLVDAHVLPSGTTQYLPSLKGLALLRDSMPELPRGSGVVLILEPVATTVRRELWRLIVAHPPLWLVRTRGRVSWIVICHSTADADELADALNLVGDPHRVSCLSVMVEGGTLATDIARGFPQRPSGSG